MLANIFELHYTEKMFLIENGKHDTKQFKKL